MTAPWLADLEDHLLNPGPTHADDIRRLLTFAREVADVFEDLARADPAPGSDERVTLARLNTALGRLSVGVGS